MSRARHFVEPVAIGRFVTIRSARIVDAQRHVLDEQTDDGNADVPDHTPWISNRHPWGTLIDRRRTAAVFHEIAVPNRLSTFEPRQRMKGWDVGLQVSACL